MIFEEALAALRQGKKIRYFIMPEDEYYIAVYHGFSPIIHNGNLVTESFEETKARGIFMYHMKGDKIHKNHIPQPRCYSDKNPCENDPLPKINLFCLTRDDWEILEDKQ